MDNTILYHYCSNNAFHSIIENHRIWLSALSLSNDSMEGKLVAEILTRIAEADGLDQPATQRLQKLVSGLEEVFDGLGFCLSEKGDLLSQWRGYAADATGVSIGFSKDYLEQLGKASRSENKPGFTLNKVEYEPEIQENLIRPTYIEIKKLINEGAFKRVKRGLLDVRSDDEVRRDNEKVRDASSRLLMTLFPLFTKLFLLKTRAFREEREWRLISYFTKTGDDMCSFRALNDRIVPYREFELFKSQGSSIVKVILGPKNTTPSYVIESFLRQREFPDVTILRSEASYR